MTKTKWIVVIDFSGASASGEIHDWTIIPYEPFTFPEGFEKMGHLPKCGSSGGIWDAGGCRGFFGFDEDGSAIINETGWDHSHESFIAWKKMVAMGWPLRG